MRSYWKSRIGMLIPSLFLSLILCHGVAAEERLSNMGIEAMNRLSSSETMLSDPERLTKFAVTWHQAGKQVIDVVAGDPRNLATFDNISVSEVKRLASLNSNKNAIYELLSKHESSKVFNEIKEKVRQKQEYRMMSDRKLLRKWILSILIVQRRLEPKLCLWIIWC